jgi:GWxTD domain-containing protein
VDAVERRAYLALPSEAERERFIEQFWQRRDPTPDTVKNEFKDEHYRRISFANLHFGSGVPGWRTDRGRIYITYGPPDSIAAHPAGGPELASAAREVWRYRYLEPLRSDVDFEFVDSRNTGDFLLVRTTGRSAVPAKPPVEGGIPREGRIVIDPEFARNNLISQVKPVYPPLAKQARISGVVSFEILIDKEGHVSEANMLMGHPLLAERAKTAVHGLIYRPMLLNGQPVEAITRADVQFTLSQ